MGGAASITESASKVSEEKVNLKKFLECFLPLADTGKKNNAARKQAWLACDPNGNGYASLAETDGWIKKSLYAMYGDGEGDDLWKLYRPSYIRAFNDAKDTAPEKDVKGANATTDDYVTRNEFRICCAFICLYATMDDAFSMVDGGGEGVTATDDRRMSLDEFKAGWDKIGTAYGLAGLAEIADEAKGDVTPDSVFAEIDADGKGMVLLNEWCAWLKTKEVDAGGISARMLTTGDDDE